MNRELRRLVISIVTVVTFLALFFMTNPLVQRLGTGKIQEAAKAGGSRVVHNIMWQGVIPQVLAVLACFVVAAIVGIIVGRKLPRVESQKGQRRRHSPR